MSKRYQNPHQNTSKDARLKSKANGLAPLSRGEAILLPDLSRSRGFKKSQEQSSTTEEGQVPQPQKAEVFVQHERGPYQLLIDMFVTHIADEDSSDFSQQIAQDSTISYELVNSAIHKAEAERVRRLSYLERR